MKLLIAILIWLAVALPLVAIICVLFPLNPVIRAFASFLIGILAMYMARAYLASGDIP